ncbi:tyrosine-type recombinase/integrase [Pseudoxanthomonas mexicana]
MKLPKAKGLPAAIETGSLRTVMQAIDAYPDRMVRSALLLTAFTALRPSNVVSVCWSYIDLQAGRIRFPAEAMKTGEAHEVPIPTQAIALLEEARIWARGDKYADLVFPTINGTKTDHLHCDTLSKALRESGLRDAHVPHGFRASPTSQAQRIHSPKLDHPTREYMAGLPLFAGLELDRIHWVGSESDASSALQTLLLASALGFDKETRPTFVAGDVPMGPDVIQLATVDQAFCVSPAEEGRGQGSYLLPF